ncbi:MAG: hypothetical protein IKR86_06345 [Candidatus Methanomethylophilaceae archaeon]|nr:hypothetical protein [Candidatus Methanomethylophilaceae archaeon]
MNKVLKLASLIVALLLCIIGTSTCKKEDPNSLKGTKWVANETETLKCTIEFTTASDVIIYEYGIDNNGVAGVEKFYGTYTYYDSFVSIYLAETNETLSGIVEGSRLTIGKLVFLKQ